MGGGYIGVSIFFTLSGYLITSLLLAESNATGSVRAGAFLARRARRLLPASAVCILGVALCSRYGLLDGVANLQRDLLGAAFQVQNWVLLASDDSYTEVLATVGGQRSPLEHYWSLAIEEQFYWMWPLVFGWLATRRRDRLMGWLTGLTVAAVVAAPLIAFVWGSDAAYWATPARLAEILFGAWLAVVLTGRSLGGSSARLAPLALGALVLAAILLPADGGLMYRGGLPLVGAASALLIAGLQVPGRLRGLLAARPARRPGSHQLRRLPLPLADLRDPRRGPHRSQRSGACSGSGWQRRFSLPRCRSCLIERPIRRADWRPRPTLAGAAVATMAVALAAILVPVTIADDYWRAAPDDIAALVARVSTTQPAAPTPPPETVESTIAARSAATSIPAPVEPTAPTDSVSGVERPATVITTLPDATGSQPAPTGPVRVLMVGDSTAEALGVGLAGWAGAHPTLADVRLAVSPGCGFVRGGEVATDGDVPFAESCDQLLGHVLPDTLGEFRPEVVMLLCTRRDLEDRQWSDEEGTLDPFDAAYQQRLNEDYARDRRAGDGIRCDRRLRAGSAGRSVLARSGDDAGLRRTTCHRRRRDAATGGGGRRRADARPTGVGRSQRPRHQPDGATGRHALDAGGGVRSDGSVARAGVAVDRQTIMSDLA